MTSLEDEGLTLKKEKCQFKLDKVQYLGHTISADGFKPSESKTRAIVDAPQPQNVSHLRSFLVWRAKPLPAQARVWPARLGLSWVWSTTMGSSYQKY